jgi:heme A synthase
MENFHRYLGESLFIIYVIVMIVIFVMGRRDKAVPPWLTGAAHGLLGIQIAVGAILLISGGLRGVSWLHPVVGIAAMLALGLMPVFKARLRPGYGEVAGFGLVAILALAAQMIAMMSR